jgi:hypothetical protein
MYTLANPVPLDTMGGTPPIVMVDSSPYMNHHFAPIENLEDL